MLYITERNARRILKYDIMTGEVEEFLSLSSNSNPTSIAVYPYPGEG